MYDSFADELVKISSGVWGRNYRPDSGKGYSPEQKERIKRILGTAGVTAVGTGLGYGVGSAVGRLAGFKKPGLGRSKALMSAIGGLAALGGATLHQKKRKYID